MPFFFLLFFYFFFYRGRIVDALFFSFLFSFSELYIPDRQNNWRLFIIQTDTFYLFLFFLPSSHFHLFLSSTLAHRSLPPIINGFATLRPNDCPPHAIVLATRTRFLVR